MAGRRRVRRIVVVVALVLLLLLGVGAVMIVPRWGALQALRMTMQPKPELGTLPEGITRVTGPEALGFAEALIARPSAGGDRPVIVFVPGVTDDHGIRNPRVVHAADAFRQAGHIVFVPDIVMFNDPGRADDDDLTRLVRLYEQVADGKIAGSQKNAFGAFGVSLGAALALNALSIFRANGGRGCRAALCLGMPGNLYAEAMRWFVIPQLPEDAPSGPEKASSDAGLFGRNVIYRTAIPALIPHDGDGAKLKKWLDDSWRGDGKPEGLKTEAARWFVSSFRGGVDAWRRDREKVIGAAWGLMRHNSPADFRDRFKDLAGVTIFLMHGVHDPQVQISNLAHLEMFLGKVTTVVALRSHLVSHAHVVDVSIAEKFRHLVFMDDFFDMVGG